VALAVATTQRKELTGSAINQKCYCCGTTFQNAGAPTHQVTGATHFELRKPPARVRDNVTGWNHRGRRLQVTHPKIHGRDFGSERE
jgi:hypothetical protein